MFEFLEDLLRTTWPGSGPLARVRRRKERGAEEEPRTEEPRAGEEPSPRPGGADRD